MTRLKTLSGREVVRALTSFGFVLVSMHGSHGKMRRVLSSGETQTLTIPIHKELAGGTLRAIFRRATRYIPEEDLHPWFFHGDR
ncbi:MAG TPA: type II toxin-antitoxin system HicA family toxin [Terriglobales bacterium]|nr:type II toxin-antitoxin system HicA family toxin [Terriglobales bacterium]